jgi:hypothetical protein
VPIKLRRGVPTGTPAVASILDRPIGHRRLLGGLAALGVAAVAGAAVPRADAAYVTGPPDRIDTNLDVDGTLTVDGNVGVGTPTPSARLHVRNGSLHLGPYTNYNNEGFLSLAGAGAALSIARRSLAAWPATPVAGDAFRLYVETGDGSFRLWTHVKGDLLTVTSDGKLGVGTAAPAATLDVAGDLKVAGGLQFAGNLGVGVATPSARLHVRGGAAHFGFYTNYVREGHLSLAGTGASLGLTRTNLTEWPTAPAAGDQFWLYNNAGVFRLWTHATGDLLSVTADGKVGLGVLAPSARLDVGGDARIGGVATVVGNVGVGTAAPSARLHVRGGALHVGFHTSSNSEGHLSLAGAGAGLSLARTNLAAWPTAPAAGDQFWLYNNAGVFRLWTWGAGDLLTLTSAGNLGLGTLTPTARLDVVGSARIAGPLTVSGPITVNGVTAIDAAGAALKTYYAP